MRQEDLAMLDALSRMVADRLLQRGGGAGNPFGYPPRPATPIEYGVGHSGSYKEVRLGDTAGFLKVNLREIVPQGYQGLASVHVFTRDVTEVPANEDVVNGRLVADLSWQSGDGGGECQVDLTRGTFFTCSGTTSIEMHARWETALEGVPMHLWATKRIEATVHWGSSISPKAAMATAPSVNLVQGQPASGWIRIPQQAHSMLALSTQPEFFPTLRAEFSTSNIGGGGGGASVKYSTLNPNANGTPIVQGVEFVRFVAGEVPMRVFPVFELWI